MHGYVIKALQSLIIREYGGRHVWDHIVELAAQKPEEHRGVCERRFYDDDFTFRLLREASELCGVSKNELLEAFGKQFLIWCREYAYDRTLQYLGATIRDFLCNLDSLHDHLETHMFPGMTAPSFHCSDGPSDELYLHYYSRRRGLEYLVIGILKAVCRQLHNTIVEVEILQQVDDIHDHVVFAIKDLGPVSLEYNKQASSHSLQMFKPDRYYTNDVNWSPVAATQFCQIFPFHIIFDDQQRILQMGTSLFRVLSNYDIDVQQVRLSEILEVERPQGMTFDFFCLKSYINTVFSVSLKNTDSSLPLRLKGQMMVLDKEENCSEKMLFLCSPRVGDLSDLSSRRLYLSDLPLHDATRDLMLLDDARSKQYSQIIKLEDINSRLDVANKQLVKAHKELAKQKDLTDRLLYSMFPVHVATQLKRNEEVDAESFSSVTILFSDVVEFTTICGRCHPAQIVGMLDRLYKEFDAVTWENKLYKVETIGDAYMVVGGLTDKTVCHEEMVCNQALDMITVATKVKNPIDSEDHIHIRVGIHSGEAMAGVVGHLMPRYCLFGDTVNIASRTESTGQPDRIQVTEVTCK
jgi:guanylate cyclase soluble subunit beta